MQTKHRWALAILILLGAFGKANAGPIFNSGNEKTADVQLIEVMDYGIYTAEKTASGTNDLGLAHYVVNNIQLITATTTVSVKPGVKFGFRYAIYGKPIDAPVTVKQVTIYPPAGVKSPKTGLLHANSFSTSIPVGLRGVFAGYQVEEPWELVPGPWTIQLWIGDRKLAEQTFTVVTPETMSH